MRRILTLAVIVILTVADQAIKIFARNALEGKEAVELGGFIGFRYVENTGMAFSLLSGKTVLLSVFTALMLILITAVLMSNKIKDRIFYASLVMIVSGGAGNLYDRIFRGFVIDYIEPLFVDFAVFNFADCLITVGSFGIILYLIIDTVKEKKKENQKEEQEN